MLHLTPSSAWAWHLGAPPITHTTSGIRGQPCCRRRAEGRLRGVSEGHHGRPTRNTAHRRPLAGASLRRTLRGDTGLYLGDLGGSGARAGLNPRGLHSFMTGEEPRGEAGAQGLPGGGCEAMAPRQHSWQLWGAQIPTALAPTLDLSPVDLDR